LAYFLLNHRLHVEMGRNLILSACDYLILSPSI